MGAIGLLLHYDSNAEVAGCFEGSSTAKQSSSATETPPGGVLSDSQYRLNSLVDLADFAPNVPCGVRSHDFRLLGT